MSASKKLSKKDALLLWADVTEVHVAKGQKVVSYKKKAAELSDDAVAEMMLGPTGNLRAPTLRIKKRLYVGFPKEGFEGL